MAFNIFKRKSQKNKDSETKTEEVETPALSPDTEEETTDDDQSPKVPLSPEEDQENDQVDEVPSSGGLYKRLRNGLTKTRQILTTDVDQLFSSGQQVTQDMLDDLEERLITADLGVGTAMEIVERLSSSKFSDSAHFKSSLKDIFLSYLKDSKRPFEILEQTVKPLVILVVGVNGVGKTTTIGKLAAKYTQSGKQVMLVAADTFRAAAIEQLGIWAERTGADLVKHRDNADPAAVVYDGLEAAQARGTDIVLIDTAGRLHTKVNLMEELKKIKRTITKKIPDAPHEVWLVLDATTGQNALSQAEMFIKATGVTGITLTKLDGTAKGGIVVNLCHSFQVPLRFIGVGEQINDLQPFDPDEFIEALF